MSDTLVSAQALPSFMRRVLLTAAAALTASFVFIAASIAFRDYMRDANVYDETMRLIAQEMVAVLDTNTSDEQVQASVDALGGVLSAIQGQVDPNEPPFYVLVMQRDGQRMFRPSNHPRGPAREFPELAALNMRTVADGKSELRVGEVRLSLAVASSPRWRLALVVDADLRNRWYAEGMLSELLPYLAMALVVIVLPTWWAVRKAIQPLQDLSAAVASRAPHDTQALQLAPTYRELQPLHAALNRLFEKLAQAMAREKAFVNDAAHELRTPLAVIATQAHVLTQADADGRAQAAQRLQGAVKRASHLSHQLLQLAHTDGLLTMQPKGVDVMNLVRDVMVGFTERAQAQGSDLSLHGPDSLVVPSDARALHSIAENLVDNALRYGGEGVTVEVHVDADANGWRLRVADDGPGLPAAERSRAFERFWRADTGRSPGSGLGLAIVREAVRALGGSVHIETGLNQRGCGVVVQLPGGVFSEP